MRRLRTSEIRAYRQQAVIDQNYRCALCAHALTQEDAVLDHAHDTGQIRQAIHRFCNTFLGKIENGAKRNRIHPDQLSAILCNYTEYVNTQQQILHPTHRTPDERAELTRRRARRRRAARKQQ